MDKDDFKKITDQVEKIKADYDRVKKLLWLYSTCDSNFVSETLGKIDQLDQGQLEFLWDVYAKMSHNLGSLGYCADEDVSTFDDAREDARQLIFHTRRDGRTNSNQ